MDARFAELLERLPAAPRVVVLTGAGVSAESGVPTFRGPGGLWRGHRSEELATPEAFERDPALVWMWYAWRRELVARAEPNAAHLAVAALEAALPQTRVVTQNVDGLHARAGTRRLLELHGSLWRLRCTVEGDAREDARVPLPELPPRCERCGALLRPDVVWYGESLPADVLDEAVAAARAADLVLVVGTSSIVAPASALPLVALENGRSVVEIDPEPTALSPRATLALRGRAGELLPPLVGALLARARGGGAGGRPA